MAGILRLSSLIPAGLIAESTAEDRGVVAWYRLQGECCLAIDGR